MGLDAGAARLADAAGAFVGVNGWPSSASPLWAECSPPLRRLEGDGKALNGVAVVHIGLGALYNAVYARTRYALVNASSVGIFAMNV